MEYCLLASSSKGNGFWVRHEGINVLIDAGAPMRDVRSLFEKQKVEKLDYLFITHDHQDHSKNRARVVEDWDAHDLSKGEGVIHDDNGFEIEPIEIPHDVETYGAVITGGKKKMMFLSDMGSFNSNILWIWPLLQQLRAVVRL